MPIDDVWRRPPQRAIRWVEKAIDGGARVVSTRRMRGAGSAAVHAVSVSGPAGSRHELVLRRFVQADWLRDEPDLAEREARALGLLAGSDVPAPRLVAFDAAGTECDVPAVLMTRLGGRVVLSPAYSPANLRSMATVLAQVHAVPTRPTDKLSQYQRYNAPDELRPPRWSEEPGVWERAIEIISSTPPRERVSFVHRDYHPGNVVWTRGRLSGVVDWVMACEGPAAVDVSHCRTNLAILFDTDSADRFLDECEAVNAIHEHDHYWDLVDILDFLPGPVDWPGSREQGRPDLTVEKVHAKLEAYLRSVLSRV